MNNTHPVNRIWLYPRDRETIEIVILGALPDAAVMYAQIKKLADQWVGWVTVEALSFTGVVLGIVAKLGPDAYHDEALLEVYRMMAELDCERADIRGARKIEWRDGVQTAIGEW